MKLNFEHLNAEAKVWLERCAVGGLGSLARAIKELQAYFVLLGNSVNVRRVGESMRILSFSDLQTQDEWVIGYTERFKGGWLMCNHGLSRTLLRGTDSGSVLQYSVVSLA